MYRILLDNTELKTVYAMRHQATGIEGGEGFRNTLCYIGNPLENTLEVFKYSKIQKNFISEH